MTVQTLKLRGERFVLLKEKDYRDLKLKAAKAKSRSKRRNSTSTDEGDAAESRRRMKEPGGRSLAEVRKRLGL